VEPDKFQKAAEERRMGVIIASKELVDEDPNWWWFLHEVKVLEYDEVRLFPYDVVAFTGCCEYFDALEPGELLPQYDLVLQRHHTPVFQASLPGVSVELYMPKLSGARKTLARREFERYAPQEGTA